jgi:succinate-semialdehyde dehydrogenase/glutarate-semialdehyde dehydrogenase
MAAQLSSSDEATMLDRTFLREACYIGGEWVNADNGRTITVTDPATGEVVGQVPEMGAEETRRAIEAAQAAMPAWAALTGKERFAVLRRFYELIVANQEALASLLTREQGKSLAEARGEVLYGASFIEWFAEEAKRVYGDIIPSHARDKRIVVLRQPIGVVGAITPWNFPNAMITRKVGPALAAGCTVVLKPASETPFSALALAVLAEQAGVPAGVLNVVTGSGRVIGAELATNDIVKKISFTGSTEVGRVLMRQSSDTIKKLSLELGGNAPFIVFDDADVDAAVEGAIQSKFRNSGQTCVCSNRLYAQAAIHDEFVAKLAERVSSLKVAAGTTAGAEVGPLINTAAVEKVESHIADATSKGATVVAGGKRHSLGGSFFEPTLLTGVTQAMLVTHEETFGPLAPVIRFDTEEEAIRLANDSEFGLASYIYARDLGRVWRVAEAIESGMVGVNTGLISTEVAPFGGVKQSGLGREGSKYGMEDYTELKYVCLGL